MRLRPPAHPAAFLSISLNEAAFESFFPLQLVLGTNGMPVIQSHDTLSCYVTHGFSQHVQMGGWAVAAWAPTPFT